MSHVGRWEADDKRALERVLLSSKVCPKHRTDLQPVALYEDVWSCRECRETWHLPDDPDYRDAVKDKLREG